MTAPAPRPEARRSRAWSPRALLAGFAALTLAHGVHAQNGVGDDLFEGQGWRWETLDLDVWIEADAGELHLEGHGTLVLEAERSSGPLLAVNGALLGFESASSPAGKVELGSRSFPGSGKPVPIARFTCNEPRARGAQLTVDFECHGSGRSGQFVVAREGALASWVEAWYPLPVGDPNELSRRLAARGVTRFHLPEGWQSVSNGARGPQQDDGTQNGSEDNTEEWRLAEPVARSFACAPFEESTLDVDGRAVGIHRLRGAGPVDVELGAIAGILRALEKRYGPYPYAGYRVVEVPPGVGDFLGSSEQGFILVRPVAFDAPDGNLALFGHEMAHGWWGNRVASAGPGAMLLSEGLAQFSAVVAIAAIEGEAGATDFLRFSRPGYVDDQCARAYFDDVRRGKDQALATLDGGPQAHHLVDCKAHWVLEMLRRRIGDERFFGVLRAVIRDFAETPLTLPELRARFEKAAPEAELARFFAEWLDRAGAPVLEADWTFADGRASVRVSQVQAGEPYHLPLEIALDSPAGRTLHAVELSEREQRFELPCASAPTGIELDPQHHVLMWTSEYGPKPGQ